jgi:3-hydroxymyristoyl/3-hydroxydecanoyl-(acyl carrier protein) dehydratase
MRTNTPPDYLPVEKERHVKLAAGDAAGGTAGAAGGVATADFVFELPPDLFWFGGHFEGTPILPGVAQLHWALVFARKVFPAAGDAVFNEAPAVKFFSPLVPGDRCKLSLTYDIAAARLTFSYARILPAGENQTASKGSIKLG